MAIKTLRLTSDQDIWIELIDRAGIVHTFDISHRDAIDLNTRLSMALSEDRMQRWHEILPDERLSDTL